MNATQSSANRSARLAGGVLLLGSLVLCGQAVAQSAVGCTAGGYRVVGTHWDAVLSRNWELRQDCLHPEWPVRSVATAAQVVAEVATREQRVADAITPLVVRAGDSVRLWQQEQNLRIELTGVAEQGGRVGQTIAVRVAGRRDEEGQSVRSMSGIVRGIGDVEMGQ